MRKNPITRDTVDKECHDITHPTGMLVCRITLFYLLCSSLLYTGINYDHCEFEDRAKYAGFDAVDAYRSRFNPRFQRLEGRDCHGHGTHVASLAAGPSSRAAPRATVYSVRIMDCNGRAPASIIISGLSYAAYRIRSLRRPAVVSMSLGGPGLRCLDAAVERAWCLGVTVVASAGNGNHANACRHSPARSPFSITVGATT